MGLGLATGFRVRFRVWALGIRTGGLEVGLELCLQLGLGLGLQLGLGVRV